MTAVLTALLLTIAPPPLVEPPPFVDLTSGATATAPAVRLDPPPPPVELAPLPTFSNDCDEMRYYRAGVGLPVRFDAIGWRESNCRNEDGVRTSCCFGWWQLSVAVHLRDRRLAHRYHDCGVWSYDDVNSDTAADKLRQACAAKALFDVVGYSAWSTS